MSTINLLYKREYAINEHIKIMIPTLGDVLDHEDEYYTIVSLLTAMPIDMMAQLDNIGVDFEEINDYDLFLLVASTISGMDTSLIFGDLDLSKFKLCADPVNGILVLRDEESGTVIDRAIQTQIALVLRTIHGLEKNTRRPANKESRDYLMELAKKKLKRQKRRSKDSILEQQIIAMVNTEQFSYRFDNVRDMTIYQFNKSVRQVVRKIDIDNKMRGIYAGTLDAKKIGQSELNWLTQTKIGGN